MSLGTKEEISQEQRETFARAAQAFGEQMDEIVEKIGNGEAKEITVPAVKVASGSPDAQQREIERAQAAAGGANSDKKQPRKRSRRKRAQLTDEQIFNKVALFLDPELLGPIFLSKPISRMVFIAKYPRFGDMLSAERIFGDEPISPSEQMQALYETVGELSTAVMGWLFENEPGLEKIKENPGDVTKWPQLREWHTLSSRDPRTPFIVKALWEQYLEWKLDVTPGDDELEKYYGLTS